MGNLLKLIKTAVTEEKSLSDEQLKILSETIQAKIDGKAEELSKVKKSIDGEELKQKITEKVEEKTEEIREELEKEVKESHESELSKFSDFVNQVVEEMLSELEEDVIHYAKLGEVYEDVVESIKERIMIQEGVLPDEVKELMKDSKELVEKLESQQDEITAENLDLKLELDKIKTQLLVTEKTKDLQENLTKIVKEYFSNTSVDETEKEIDSFITSLIKMSKNDDDDNDNDLDEDDKTKDDDIINDGNDDDTDKNPMNKYLSTYKEFE